MFFFYLTDVHPGDGGLIVLPGSHKANFERPPEMFYPGSYKDGTYNNDYNSFEVPAGIKNFNPKAGDVVVISELLVHGALSWQAKDRDRRFFVVVGGGGGRISKGDGSAATPRMHRSSRYARQSKPFR